MIFDKNLNWPSMKSKKQVFTILISLSKKMKKQIFQKMLIIFLKNSLLLLITFDDIKIEFNLMK
jgi:hypothetical protein